MATRRRSVRPHAASLSVTAMTATVVAALVLAACGDDDGVDDAEGDGGLSAVAAGEPFPEDRCEANRAAGELTFLTSFDFAAAASIVDVVVADERGYYDELCLDVNIVGSFSTDNYPLVASGEAQFSSGGSFAEVASFADPADPEFVVLMVEGRTPIDALIVREGEVASLDELAGTTIGVQGRTPTSIAAMLGSAGLVDGTDVTTVPLPGFDAAANFALDGIVGITGYQSNEVGQLQAQGIAIDVITPAEFAVPGSFGVVYTSAAFQGQHPTAVEDFARATARGLADALADPAGAAEFAVASAEATGNNFFLTLDGETFRWTTEAALVTSSTPSGVAPGTPDVDELQAELDVSAEYGLFGDAEAPSAADLVDASVSLAVHDGTTPVWPG